MKELVILATTRMTIFSTGRGNKASITDLDMFKKLSNDCNMVPTLRWCVDNDIELKFNAVWDAMSDDTIIHMYAMLTQEQKTYWYLTLGPESMKLEKYDE
jgi:hypothetical protein